VVVAAVVLLLQAAVGHEAPWVLWVWLIPQRQEDSAVAGLTGGMLVAWHLGLLRAAAGPGGKQAGQACMAARRQVTNGD
jgi:hypothetical protein